MDLVIALVSPFVGEPVRCGIVAALFTGAVFIYAARGWTLVEAKVPGRAIRMDLLLIGPVMIVATAVGGWIFFRALERAGLRPKA